MANTISQEQKTLKNKTLLIWEGPERTYKKQDKRFYAQMTSILIVIIVFLLFAGQFMIILLVLALLFASYALYSTPPGKTTYTLSTGGVEFADEFVPWDKVGFFFISKKLDGTVIELDLNTTSILKRRFLIPDSKETLDKAVKILEEYVPKTNPNAARKGILDKILDKTGLTLKD